MQSQQYIEKLCQITGFVSTPSFAVVQTDTDAVCVVLSNTHNCNDYVEEDSGYFVVRVAPSIL